MMNREKAKELLEEGELLSYHTWIFSKTYMSCAEGCYYDFLVDVKETLDIIENYCSGKWDEVEVI